MFLSTGIPCAGDIYRNILCENHGQHAGFPAIKIRIKDKTSVE